MSLDYYAFRKNRTDHGALEQKEPHLAYLWHEAVDTDKKKKNAVRDAWQKQLTVADNPWQEKHSDFYKIPDCFGFAPDTSAIAWLPWFSFMLQVPFKLHKPFLSKNEENFYLLENPLRREKTFKTPMVAASGWKGALRAAMVQQLVQWWTGLEAAEREEHINRKGFVSWRLQLVRLFGTERGTEIDDKNYNQYLDKLGGKLQARWFRRCLRFLMAENGFLAGRLRFFPTFFQEVDLEVINPHNRSTGISRHGPISLECVPQNAEGNLSLLYVPFGPLGRNEETRREAVAQDLVLLAEGMRAMLTLYGFGAKTSSGFGVAEERLSGEGKLALKAMLPAKTAEADVMLQQFRELPRYLEVPGRLIEELRYPDGGLKGEGEYRQWLESRGRKYNKEKQQLYARAKAWWEREGKLLAGAVSRGTEPEPQPPQEEPLSVTEVSFNTLEKLSNRAREVAAGLKKGGAA